MFQHKVPSQALSSSMCEHLNGQVCGVNRHLLFMLAEFIYLY